MAKEPFERGAPAVIAGAQVREYPWSRLLRTADRSLPGAPYLRLLWLLLAASLLLRLLWLDQPPRTLIFDEQYYVNAARVILGVRPQRNFYRDSRPGLDPNTEHPPLAKLIVAASMRLLGDNAYGWRLPGILAGTASILLLYGIARRVGADPWGALLAATLLAFDNLAFVHSRIFTLDIFLLAFLLLGLYWHVGNRPTLAGAGFALAALCKESGVFGLLVVLGYEVLRSVRQEATGWVAWRPALGRLARAGATFAVVFLVLLGIMDRLWVGYAQPFEHLQRIATYGAALRETAPTAIQSYPWQWLWNKNEIPYLRDDEQIREGNRVVGRRPEILFLGAMNPYVLLLWPLGLTFAAYVWWRRRPGADLGALALAWFAGTYLPFVGLSLFGQRISYLFYFLPTLPVVALAGAYFLRAADLPRIVVWGYLAAVLLGFYGYFPFKMIP